MSALLSPILHDSGRYGEKKLCARAKGNPIMPEKLKGKHHKLSLEKVQNNFKTLWTFKAVARLQGLACRWLELAI